MSRFDPYIGLPWCDRGRGISGVDCWGLLRLVYLELRGIELPSYADSYVTAGDARELARLIAGELDPWDEIEPGAETIYDGVLMREGKFPRHIGIVVEPGLMLHVERGGTSQVERYRSGMFAHRVVGFYRHRSHE